MTPVAYIDRLPRFCIFLHKVCRAEGSKLGLTDQFLEVSRPRNHIETSGGEDWIRVQSYFSTFGDLRWLKFTADGGSSSRGRRSGMAGKARSSGSRTYR